MVGSPSEHVDNAYLSAGRTGDLVVVRTGFEAPDGLGQRPGCFRAWRAVVGQEVNSGLPKCWEPFGRRPYRDVPAGEWTHGYQYVLSCRRLRAQNPWCLVE